MEIRDGGSAPPAPPAPVEAAPPTPVEGYDTAGTITDARNMTPKQLADLATKIGNLPPEEQQRLMDAARNSTGGNPPGANPAPAGAAANPSPAGPAANPSPAGAAANPSPAGPAANPAPAAAENSNPAASQPAQSQLQQIAATSQSAATAASPEDAAALARSGFDTPAGGSTSSSGDLRGHGGSYRSSAQQPAQCAKQCAASTGAFSCQSVRADLSGRAAPQHGLVLRRRRANRRSSACFRPAGICE